MFVLSQYTPTGAAAASASIHSCSEGVVGVRESVLAHKLAAICELDLDEPESVDPPLGYGRD